MRRVRNEKGGIAAALSEAQKLVFGPFIFQAVVAARRLGILKAFSESTDPLTFKAVAKKCGLSEYAVEVTGDVLTAVGVLTPKAEGYVITKTGDCLLYDPMTVANLDFTADVCYKGLAHLGESLKSGHPEGLKELGSWPTIYPALSQLPEPAKSSWFEFDHFYSDRAFEACAAWIHKEMNPALLFDVGGNTGKFAGLCLTEMPKLHCTIIDLPSQCELIAQNPALDAVRSRLATASVDWLDEKAVPEVTGAPDIIWMSQFLDCFTEDQAVSILTRMKRFLPAHGRLAVLECLWDRQPFEAAKLSLVASSLYFTALANGNSRFFSEAKLLEIFERAGLTVESVQDGLGVAHTLYILKVAA